jgi:hypothetical protein
LSTARGLLRPTGLLYDRPVRRRAGSLAPFFAALLAVSAPFPSTGDDAGPDDATALSATDLDARPDGCLAAGRPRLCQGFADRSAPVAAAALVDRPGDCALFLDRGSPFDPRSGDPESPLVRRE